MNLGGSYQYASSSCPHWCRPEMKMGLLILCWLQVLLGFVHVSSRSCILHHLPFSWLILCRFKAYPPPPMILPIHNLSLRTFVCYRCFYKFLAMGFFFSSRLYKPFFLAHRLKSICRCHWVKISKTLNPILRISHSTAQKFFLWRFFCLDNLVLVQISMRRKGICSVLEGRLRQDWRILNTEEGCSKSLSGPRGLK